MCISMVAFTCNCNNKDYVGRMVLAACFCGANFFIYFFQQAGWEAQACQMKYIGKLYLKISLTYSGQLITGQTLVFVLPDMVLICLELTLIGMWEGTFHHLSFLDQIFSAEFLSKKFRVFFELKIDINRANLTPCQTY